jgi:hypothetical protein
MWVAMLWLLLVLVLVLLLALLSGPLVTVRQLGQVLLGTRLHIRVDEVVILQMAEHANTKSAHLLSSLLQAAKY